MDGSEIIELQNNKIPGDVLLSLKAERAKNAALNVLPASIYKVSILMYHYVENVKDSNDKIRISLNTPPYILEEQIKTLTDAKYTFMTNQEFSEVIEGKKFLPPNPILLTFDDGYEDFYTDVLPILRKYNIKATNYIISGFINRGNHMSDSQIQETINSGLVEIGAHTVHHSWLKGRSLNDSLYEAENSKIELEKRYNIKVTSFAYPFGAFDNQAIEAVKKSNFTTAVSTIPGNEQSKENKYFLFRLRPGARTGKTLLDWLSQPSFSEY